MALRFFADALPKLLRDAPASAVALLRAVARPVPKPKRVAFLRTQAHPAWLRSGRWPDLLHGPVFGCIRIRIRGSSTPKNNEEIIANGLRCSRKTVRVVSWIIQSSTALSLLLDSKFEKSKSLKVRFAAGFQNTSEYLF